MTCFTLQAVLTLLQQEWNKGMIVKIWLEKSFPYNNRQNTALNTNMFNYNRHNGQYVLLNPLSNTSSFCYNTTFPRTDAQPDYAKMTGSRDEFKLRKIRATLFCIRIYDGVQNEAVEKKNDVSRCSFGASRNWKPKISLPPTDSYSGIPLKAIS